eukprot:1133781-Rhodomonas_salina.2
MVVQEVVLSGVVTVSLGPIYCTSRSKHCARSPAPCSQSFASGRGSRVQGLGSRVWGLGPKLRYLRKHDPDQLEHEGEGGGLGILYEQVHVHVAWYRGRALSTGHRVAESLADSSIGAKSVPDIA